MDNSEQHATGLIAAYDKLIDDAIALAKAAELLADGISIKRESLINIVADLKQHIIHADHSRSVVSGIVDYVETGRVHPAQPEAQQAA